MGVYCIWASGVASAYVVRYRLDQLSLIQDLYCINFCLSKKKNPFYFSVPSNDNLSNAATCGASLRL